MVRACPLLLAACALSCGSRDRAGVPDSSSSGVEVQAGWYSSLDAPIRLLEDGGSLPLPDLVEVDVWWGRLEKRS
ncbi:MAG: hypothetical protein IPM35_40595 [Myxococcales bacterium]|nr:hypothetical protein [Myxococcales bacterium]